jgi:oligosaccharyltransferase complex subunit alpha (ribophorin I)
MPKCWLSLLLFLSVTSALASSQSFENTAIVRTVELGGSIVHVTTTYAVKALEDGLKTYTVTLGRDEKAKTSWLQATVKGQKTVLPVRERPFDSNKYALFAVFYRVDLSILWQSRDYHSVDIVLPKALSHNKTTNIVFESIQTHATRPYPKSVGQNEEQALKYTTDLFVLSPYPTNVQRTKIK